MREKLKVKIEKAGDFRQALNGEHKSRSGERQSKTSLTVQTERLNSEMG